MADQAFQTEQKVYDANLQKWLSEGSAGQYIVIHNDEIVGPFPNSSIAFSTGAEKFGIGAFFMSQILPTDATNITFLGLVV